MSIRPPRVRMITFHSCHCLIYCRRFVQYRTLLCDASSSASIQPYMRFLSVSASVCVRLPSDSTSRWTPLSFANSSYCQACSGLSPPSYHPCRAHIRRRLGLLSQPPFLSCIGIADRICRDLKEFDFVFCREFFPSIQRMDGLFIFDVPI